MNTRSLRQGFFELMLWAFWGALAFIPVAAWLTHIAVCFRADKWGFLIAGAIFFPIAIVHGIGIWFGWW